MQLYDRHDREKKGFLDLEQAKKFMSTLFELDYTQNSDRITFRKFLKIVDVNQRNIVVKQHLKQFFSLPNFLELLQVNSDLDMNKSNS